eukprot:jgi/Antlo1/25/1667
MLCSPMILKYFGKNLFIDGRLLVFHENVRMAAAYKDYVVVLAGRLFFHDFVSFSVSVCAPCFLDDKVYFQDGGIYSFAGPYDRPALELVASGILVGVKWGYALLRRKNNVFALRKGQEETLVDLSRGLRDCRLRKYMRIGDLNSAEMDERCTNCSIADTLCTHNTQIHVVCIAEYILFYREKDVLFLDRKLKIKVYSFTESVYFTGLVKIERRLHLAVNDRVFTGADADKRYRIVGKPAVDQNYYEMLQDDNCLLQSTDSARTVSLRFKPDDRDKILMDCTFSARNMSGEEAARFFVKRESWFEREMLRRYSLGCTEKEAVVFFETEMLKRRSPSLFARTNLETIRLLSPEYYNKFQAFLRVDDDEKSSPEHVSKYMYSAPVQMDDLKEYLLQVHKGRQVNYEDVEGGSESGRLILRRTYSIKKEFLTYRTLIQTPWVLQHNIPVCGDDVPLFKLDESDIENRREKAYVLRKASWSSLPLLKLYSADAYLPDLCLKIKKGRDEFFQAHHKDWDKNPRFNYGVCTVLSRNVQEEILLFEESKPSILTGVFADKHASGKTSEHESSKQENSESRDVALLAKEYELAGHVYALGLLGMIRRPLPAVTEFIDFVSQISLSHNVRTDYSLLPLPETLLKRTANVISLGFSFRGTRNQHVASILRAESSRFGLLNGKGWIDEYYRLSAGFSLYLVGHRWASIDDRLVEVIYNGLTFFNTKNRFVLKRLRRGKYDRMEEIFYSSFFSRGVMGEYIDVTEFEKNMTLSEIYRKAGEYFYIGVSSIVHEEDAEARATSRSSRSSEFPDARGRKMVELCLVAEDAMEANSDYKFLFDILLVSTALLFNGTSNTDVLRIARRQLLKVSKLGNLQKIVDFVEGRYETQYGLRYGDYIRYKMCIGLLFVKLQKNSLFEIVSSFYVNFPLSATDQRAFQIYRHLLVTKAERIQRKHTCNNIGLDIESSTACTGEMCKKDRMIYFDALCRHMENGGTAENIGFDAFGLERELYDSVVGR